MRRDGGRVIAGVAGGIADHLGVDAFRVRVVFMVLAALAGAGVLAYGLLWFFCPPGRDTAPPGPGERRQAYGLALVGLVAMSVVGFATSGTPAAYLVPFVFVVIGASLVWREFDTSHSTPRTPLLTWTRFIGGALLVIGGLVVIVLAGDRSFGGLSTTLLAVVATLIGVVLLTVPLWMRMWRALNEERAARIRNAEREEIASHLHDSVLQTLALIQKQAGRPEEVARLARSQERELRGWLFGDPAQRAGSLSASLQEVGAEVEDHYGIEVGVITVGDLRPEDEPAAQRRRWAALVAATREALINAAKHSGERKVDVYGEVTDDQVEVFVRDRGIGFDPELVDGDRHGITRSITARMHRADGEATIDSAPGRGTNVRLVMPRESGGGHADPDGSSVDKGAGQTGSAGTADNTSGAGRPSHLDAGQTREAS
ncbi:PspC domain-containing protein [Gordonia sp. Z-3]|uniref:ATP-binding protein n=1 Tax=unclassified Gordonia (in: high G+C Gram-positive bacteria) TaxID=2657482 RepID=UPI000C36CEB1|nr:MULTISPECIES: ATP-binding protein [unclassified Gordonia (in: high G+C Gram-positive bacteria)]MAU83562.1 histidine kinase [Gordonia sp. (in: high G+C Gram-positive bacteria)]MED5801416.1 PspC domain-containing protein [Gordonia sp. Z-3]